jgi:hypothetical protein
MFISKPHLGRVYIAELNHKGRTLSVRKLLWSLWPTLERIEASEVPITVRRRAYRSLAE